ncbi:MAG: PKD domain-containing protein [Brumimicrobium sp.]|nr:PKD domain-containing protein [Brumimicrobium sp.]
MKVVFIGILFSLNSFAQSPIPCSNPADPPGETACLATPICDFNGYCGRTLSSYSSDAWTDLKNAIKAATIDQWGIDWLTIENDSYLKFIASSSSITFNVYVYDCNGAGTKAIQVVFFKADNCSGGPVTVVYANKEMVQQGAAHNVTVTGLTPGDVYYILIDGYSGKNCGYTFEAVAGVQSPAVQIDIAPQVTVCPGDQITATASGGDNSYQWTGTGLSSATGTSVIITAPTTPGSYSYGVEATGGTAFCPQSSTAQLTVIVDNCTSCTPPHLNIDNLTICTGSNIDLNTAINPNSDQANLSFYNSQADATSASSSINNITSVAGTYWVRAENPNDPTCFDVYAITITATTVSYTSSTTDANCGSNDGSLNITATDGTAPYTFSINNGPTQSNGTFSNLTAGSYSILITDNNGCQKSGTISINNLNGVTIIQLTTTDSNCGACDGVITVNGSGGTLPYTYNWMDANGLVIGGNSDQISNICSGNYSVEVTDANGCLASSVVTLGNLNAPTISLSGTNPTCGNADGSIKISGLNNNTSYGLTYQLGSETPIQITTNSDNSGNINIINLQQGTYSNFNVVDLGGCDIVSSDVITLSEPNAPVLIMPDNITVCEGETVTLTASASSGAVITWNNGINNGEPFIPNNIGVTTYTATATIDGCSSTGTTQISVEGMSNINFEGDILTGCSPLTVNFSNLTSGSFNGVCKWNFGDGLTASICDNVSHTYYAVGDYSVTLTMESLSGCASSYSQTNYIHVSPSPIASFTADPMVTNTLNPTVNFYNNSSNASSYEWDFGDYSVTNTEDSPSHTYDENNPGSYIVTLVASNGNDCNDTTRMIIKIDEEVIFFIPNTFTPDGNMFNEIFQPIFASGIDPNDFSFIIFNRWGEVIFQTKDIHAGWDGLYKGNIAKDGTYVWKLEFMETISDKRYIFNGHVNIIR